MYVVIGAILQLLRANFFNSNCFYRILEQSPPIVPYSVTVDTTQCVGGSHSSSPSVKSWLKHLNLFPDYIFVTLSTPFPLKSSSSPPPTLLSLPFPSLASKFSASNFISHYFDSSSITFGLSHPISSLRISPFSSLSCLPLYPSSSSWPRSVCACLPPSFHQMVCVKTLHLTARQIFILFFFLFKILF